MAQNLQKKITIVKDGIMQIPNSSVKKMYVAQPNVSNIQASIPPSGRIMKKPIVQPNASNSKDSHVPVCQPSANGNQMVTGMTTDLFKRAGLTITKLSTAKKPGIPKDNLELFAKFINFLSVDRCSNGPGSIGHHHKKASCSTKCFRGSSIN